VRLITASHHLTLFHSGLLQVSHQGILSSSRPPSLQQRRLRVTTHTLALFPPKKNVTFCAVTPSACSRRALSPPPPLFKR
jgi:hypothetical protein